MYYEDNDFDNYYDPSKADEILDEAMDKFKEILKQDVKDNMKYMQEENTRLKKENESLKDKTKDLDKRERALEIRERDFESKSERYFYQKKFSEILKPLEEQLDMWYVESVLEYVPKCNLCDEDREVEYKSSSGKIIKGDCDCKKYQTVYRVRHTEIKHLNFLKSDRVGKREFVLTPKYESKDYDETYFKADIQKLTKTFDIDKVSVYKYYNGYGSFSGFTIEEECQKYCDWLNFQSKNDEEE